MNINLDDEAIAAFKAHRRKGESYSKIIKRLIAPPIRTFGDLEKLLDQVEGPLFPDLKALERLRRYKQRSNYPA